jgi:hypothetical protein
MGEAFSKPILAIAFVTSSESPNSENNLVLMINRQRQHSGAYPELHSLSHAAANSFLEQGLAFCMLEA